MSVAKAAALEQLDLLDQRVQRAQPVFEELQELLDYEEVLALLDLKALQDIQVVQEPQVLLVPQAAQAELVIPVQQELLDR